MLDHQIEIAREHFGINVPEDWTMIRAEWIRQVKGCGPQTVNHLRLYLAARGLTLLDDATPEYWQKHIAAARIGTTIATTDNGVVLPFTVCIDTKEQYPFEFKGHVGDSVDDHRPLIVPTRFVDLGPTHGDYGIEGFSDCFIERKGLDDAIGTFLAHPGSERRERWEATLSFLAGCKTAAVVSEASFLNVISKVEARGKRSKLHLQKTIHRQVLAWYTDTGVPFVFCDTRRFAEQTALALLRRHHRKHFEIKQQEAQDLTAIHVAL